MRLHFGVGPDPPPPPPSLGRGTHTLQVLSGLLQGACPLSPPGYPLGHLLASARIHGHLEF